MGAQGQRDKGNIMENMPPRPCVELSEVFDPEAFRCEVAAVELAYLRDDQILAAQLDRPDPDRARSILARTGGLAPLIWMGLADHRALDLSATESARLLVMPALLPRLVKPRSAPPAFTTADAMVNEIADRSITFGDHETVGVVGADHRGRKTLDRTIYIGTAHTCFMNPNEIMREALRNDVVLMVMWFWQPAAQPTYDESMKRMVQELRVFGDVARIRLFDVLVVAESAALSIREFEGWVD